MGSDLKFHETKVPEVTLGFWIIKILATTLGETGGDTVTMTWLKADVMVNAGYLVGSAIFLSALIVLVVIQIVAKKFHPFLYWAAITFSQTLGTALGDWIADTGGLGYQGGAFVFGAGLAVTAALYYWTDVSRVLLFWTAFILTRPLGATLGDFLDKPLDHGGLALSRPIASAVIALIMVGCVLVIPQRAGSHPNTSLSKGISRW